MQARRDLRRSKTAEAREEKRVLHDSRTDLLSGTTGQQVDKENNDRLSVCLKSVI